MALLPSPSAVLELTRYAVGHVVETAAAVATVPVRAIGLLGQAELLVSRITMIADSAEALIAQVATTVAEAQQTIRSAQTIAAAAALTVEEAAVITKDAARLVGAAGEITAGAADVVEGAGRATNAAGGLLVDASAATDAATAVIARAEAVSVEAVRLLDGFAPTLSQAAPLLARFVNDLTPDEVTAAIRMVDELPRLREHLVSDVMPLLGKLDQVGPDLHNLLAVTQDLHLAIVGLPGLKMLRKRGEERVAEEEEESASKRQSRTNFG